MFKIWSIRGVAPLKLERNTIASMPAAAIPKSIAIALPILVVRCLLTPKTGNGVVKLIELKGFVRAGFHFVAVGTLEKLDVGRFREVSIVVHPSSGLVVFVGDGRNGGVPSNLPIKFEVMWFKIDVSFVEVQRSTVADRPVKLNEGGSNAECLILSDANIKLKCGMFAKDSNSTERAIDRGGRLEKYTVRTVMQGARDDGPSEFLKFVDLLRGSCF